MFVFFTIEVQDKGIGGGGGARIHLANVHGQHQTCIHIKEKNVAKNLTRRREKETLTLHL